MSLFNIFDIAGSGMRAQNVRLNLTASNLANSESIASSPEDVYRARHPVFSTVFHSTGNQQNAVASVETVAIVESQREAPKRYEPGNPLANEEGYIFGSNVDTIEEMTNMISASRSYQTNVEIMNSSKKLLLETLKIGQ
ncbi:MAG: flagellar basal body rod protein FlgC [Gammaproteobacteria bacterium]|nr:flagellar basal body rod protein FlgC [Gammaproteobacteria bacterium]